MRGWLLSIACTLLVGAGGIATARAQPEAPPFVTTPSSPSTVSPMLYVKRVGGDFDTVYKRVFQALEDNSFYVLSEQDIGRSLALHASRWGADYNRNHLDQIRSIVFCNGAYANQIGNADPRMLALCPLHITLIHRGAVTSILFVRPSRVAAGTPAEPVALHLEQDVIRAIESGVSGLPPAPTAAPAAAPPSTPVPLPTIEAPLPAGGASGQ